MTLILSEEDLEELLNMDEVVLSVEEAFRREAEGKAENAARTRSRAPGAALNAMHACLSYLGRGGLKCYVSTRAGKCFVFILFDLSDGRPLAVMGADALGRYRTGAASGVATKFLYGMTSAKLAVCGSGKQALTQVLGIAATTSLTSVSVWSPNADHREAFCKKLRSLGFDARACEGPYEALAGADVVSTITSSKDPFLEQAHVGGISHLNACGSNGPESSEVSVAALRTFNTLAVDDLRQATSEYGDLIQGVKSGDLSWDSVIELKDIIAGKVKPGKGPTFFKSGGVALEDVAVGSLVYDKAIRSGRQYTAATLAKPS